MSEAWKEKGIDYDALRKEHAEALKETKRIDMQKDLQMLESAIDVVGIADPSPASDLASASLAWARRDYVGSLLSFVSAAVPYLGDAAAKPIKMVRAQKAINELAQKAACTLEKLRHVETRMLTAQKEAAKLVKAKRAEKAALQKCPSNKWGSKLPDEGKGEWFTKDGAKGGERGNSVWKGEGAHGSLEATYKDGYLDAQSLKLNGQKATWNPKPGDTNYTDFNAKIEILDMGRSDDMLKADAAMARRLGVEKWEKPEGYTWHHGDDGVSMTLIDEKAHHALKGNNNAPITSHTGGDSLSKEF